MALVPGPCGEVWVAVLYRDWLHPDTSPEATSLKPEGEGGGMAASMMTDYLMSAVPLVVVPSANMRTWGQGAEDVALDTIVAWAASRLLALWRSTNIVWPIFWMADIPIVLGRRGGRGNI